MFDLIKPFSMQIRIRQIPCSSEKIRKQGIFLLVLEAFVCCHPRLSCSTFFATTRHSISQNAMPYVQIFSTL